MKITLEARDKKAGMSLDEIVANLDRMRTIGPPGSAGVRVYTNMRMKVVRLEGESDDRPGAVQEVPQ